MAIDSLCQGITGIVGLLHLQRNSIKNYTKENYLHLKNCENKPDIQVKVYLNAFTVKMKVVHF